MNIVRNLLPTAALLLGACAMTPPALAPPPYAASNAAPPAPQGPATPVSSRAAVPASAATTEPLSVHEIAAPVAASSAPAAPAITPRVAQSVQHKPPQVAAVPKSASVEHTAHKLRKGKRVEVTTAAKPAVTQSKTVQPRAANGVEISGRIELTAGRGQHVAPGDLAHTLVYFVPKSGNVAPRPGRFTVFTHNRAYDPGAMAIPLGSTIVFANLDDVRHNEFSVTPGSAFNLGYQAPGEKTPHTFTQPGLVLVGCLVHRQMELDVLVLPTVYVTRVSASGDFNLHGLPAGHGTLHVWNPRARPVLVPVTLPLASAVAQRLVEVKSPMAVQLNVDAQP